MSTLMVRPGDALLTVADLRKFLEPLDPELPLVGKVGGGLCDILWVTDEALDDEDEPVVMIGLDS